MIIYAERHKNFIRKQALQLHQTLIPVNLCRRLESQNLLRSTLCSYHDRARWITCRHSREYRRIHDKQVVSLSKDVSVKIRIHLQQNAHPVYFGVEVHDSFTSSASVVFANCARAHPVVRSSSTGGGWQLRDSQYMGDALSKVKNE